MASGLEAELGKRLDERTAEELAAPLAPPSEHRSKRGSAQTPLRPQHPPLRQQASSCPRRCPLLVQQSR